MQGFDLVAAEVGLAGILARADLARTGEGKFSFTSSEGKVVGEVARMASSSSSRCRWRSLAGGV